MTIEYKVIEIMNEKELIINYGSIDGAEKGDSIRVYFKGEEVLDPESQIVLGTLDVIKDELQIAVVFEKFSVCRKLVKHNYNPILNPLANRIRIEAVDLNVDKSDFSGRTSTKNPPLIKVGDSIAVLK